MNDFIVCLIETADRIRQKEAERKLEAEEWRRRRENKAAIQRQADQENENLEALEQLVIKWEKAKKLREFIQAVELKHSPVPPTSELAAWLIWADNYANILDPLNNSSIRKLRET